MQGAENISDPAARGKSGEEMKETVGFVGLGAMGKGMAHNILERGFALLVYDVQSRPVEELVEVGAQAANLGELGAQCRWIVFSLPDTAAVEAVLSPADGLGSMLKPGQVVIDCSTTHPVFTQHKAAQLAREGIEFLDAPVSGRPEGAVAGSLTIMVGGREKTFREVQALLGCMGEKVAYMGPSGHGQLAKMVNNVLFNISCAAMAEILPLAMALGLDEERICEVVSVGSGQSYGFDVFAPLVLQRNFETGYPLESAYKDMATLMELAHQLRVPVPVATAAVHTYQLALARGLGKESKGAMIKIWEEVMGVEVGREPPEAEHKEDVS